MFYVQLAGHLGNDPVTRVTPSGQKVTSFTLATKQRKGKEDVTIWVKITIWGDKFDKILAYFKKGSAAIVNGRMTPPSSYMDKEGRQQFSLEVTCEMIDFSPFGKTAEGDQQKTSAASATPNYSSAAPAYNPNSAPSYGSSAAPASNSQNNSEMEDEESLPF
jgi:single-strand DNA-binding protein